MSGRLRPVTALVVGAAGALAVAATAVATPRAATPLEVKASVVTPDTSFGDPLEVRVTVGYDAGSISRSSIEVRAGFSPYVQIAPPSVTHRLGYCPSQRCCGSGSPL